MCRYIRDPPRQIEGQAGHSAASPGRRRLTIDGFRVGSNQVEFIRLAPIANLLARAHPEPYEPPTPEFAARRPMRLATALPLSNYGS